MKPYATMNAMNAKKKQNGRNPLTKNAADPKPDENQGILAAVQAYGTAQAENYVTGKPDSAKSAPRGCIAAALTSTEFVNQPLTDQKDRRLPAHVAPR